MIGENPFTSESWERKISNEQEGESPEDLDITVFEKIKSDSMKSPELREMMADAEDAILRYNESIVKLDRAIEMGTKFSREDVENADAYRRRVHDSMIDKINLLSRSFAKANLDNNWRNVVGSDRIQIGEWARRVGAHLKNTILKEQGLE